MNAQAMQAFVRDLFRDIHATRHHEAPSAAGVGKVSNSRQTLADPNPRSRNAAGSSRIPPLSHDFERRLVIANRP